ncbi:hypothetical protein Y032_0023g743 [Ancylostoma ceylanicum]|uniref:EF-hand domain-containing protein n=1 Tax=Ancylostoma ceylanicum TaxID=53326 RepID=A0A016UZD1_9BILA|nr:hypothetical protein Y032_0023g743 [Ancylostoma ceylanicum]
MKRVSLVANGCFTSPRGLLPQGSLRKLKLHSDRGETPGGASAPLLSALDGYTEDELSEYRQVFNMFDTGSENSIQVTTYASSTRCHDQAPARGLPRAKVKTKPSSENRHFTKLPLNRKTKETP